MASRCRREIVTFKYRENDIGINQSPLSLSNGYEASSIMCGPAARFTKHNDASEVRFPSHHQVKYF